MQPRSFLLAILALTTVASAQQSRAIRQVTQVAEAHTDAKISPDGTVIVFRGPSKLAIVSYNGGTESTLVSSSALGDFLWSPLGTGVYFIDGANIRFVSRTGGNPVTIATLPGQNHRLWSVDAQDQYLYGSRSNAAVPDYRLFRVRTNGATAPVDIVINAVDAVDEVVISRDSSKIAYRAYQPVPFTPRDYWMANADGTNSTRITTPSVNGDPGSMGWLDANTLGFAAVDGLPKIFRTTGSGAVEALTASPARNCSISADGRWIVMEAQFPTGIVPAVMRTTGGGMIPLGRNGSYIFRGPPSIDAAGRRVVFAGQPLGAPFAQVFAVELDREIEVTGRVAAPSTMNVLMPAQAGEAGATFLALNQSTVLFPLFGWNYGLAVDPTFVLVLTSGAGPQSLNLPIPNDPTITGFQFWIQGLRFQGALGDFTREVMVRVL